MRKLNQVTLAILLGGLMAIASMWIFPSRAFGQEPIPAPEFTPNRGWINTKSPLSLRDDLKGHVVVLDFWTYCCINCLHVQPDLEYLREKYADEPVVLVGVHSAKFDTEAERRGIRNAVLKYDIEHPVVIDDEFGIWRAYGARAWPSFAIVDPEGNLLGLTSGEGKRELLDTIIAEQLEIHREKGTLAETRLEVVPEEAPVSLTGLTYPGKVLAVPPGADNPGRVFVADSSGDRVILASWPDEDGRLDVERILGDGERGLVDGVGEDARFHDPQGMAYHAESGTLYVADTKNHAIRTIDTSTGTVRTIAGTGVQGYDRDGGGRGVDQIISSPWALELSPDAGTLYIAMAGTHQLWSMDLTEPNGRVGLLAGSGYENIFDGPAKEAALAQPSGLALSADGERLYFADSEGSAIRELDLPAGTVRTIVGRSVTNVRIDSSLFEYGDVDGGPGKAKLQHALGVTLFPTPNGERLLVADTYNDKIKLISPNTQRSTSWAGLGRNPDPAAEGLRLEEPSGVSLVTLEDGSQTLFVADTNNHRIVRINAADNAHQELTMVWPGDASAFDPGNAPEVTIATGPVRFALDLPEGAKLERDAPVSIRFSNADGMTAVRTLEGDGLLEIDPPAFASEGATLVELGFVWCDDEAGYCVPGDASWLVTIDPSAESSPLRAEVTGP